MLAYRLNIGYFAAAATATAFVVQERKRTSYTISCSFCPRLGSEKSINFNRHSIKSTEADCSGLSRNSPAAVACCLLAAECNKHHKHDNQNRS